ncbi:hypothetical protein AK830_g5110 [Neonectria ditissima]|uniref:Uncharacterized protein n=1 Tax=Neonectria ditissima TaxID=78410 RepID=A0A0P7AU70_9HYPO|nr:hypothetical protein AK830_g5110 [Neonectria ditissima]
MADWQVDSYHISLGVVGDSSIHLISQKGGKMDRLILRGAMLVDGGAHGGDDVVMRTIKYIESSDRYDWCKFGTKGEHSLKFHVVIITHWDEDHHTGIMYAIDKNLKSKWKVQEPNPRVDFCRYDENDKPTTILYCPEVGFKTRSKPKFIPKPPEAVLRTISFMMSTGVIVKDVVQIQVEPPCRDQDLDKMPASIIGLELVKGHALKRPKDRLDLNTPSELLEYHREKYKWTAEEARLPHIFIVAASGSSFAPKDPDAHIKVVKEKKKKTWPTAKNRSSIACMIMWDSGVGERPQIAQYFGGDLPWFIEERIVKWTGMNGRRDDKGSWVPVVKLSHHGAKSSTPSLMLNSFNPRHLIASVADRNGHPSWELTFYLVPWLLNGGLSKASCPPLLATQYPYYLARYVKPDKTLDWMPLTKGPANQMNMDILLRKGTEGKEYMNELKTLWSGMSSSGIKLSGPEDLWIDAKKKDTTLEPRGWARGYVEQRWETLSPTKPSQHAATSGQAGHGAVATDPTGRLEFFLVETTASVPDGGVHVKYSVSTHLEKLWPKSSWDSPAQSTIDIPEVLGKRGPLRLSTDPEGVYGTTIRKMVKAKGLTYDEDTYIAHIGTNPGESDFNDGRELEPESELDLASPVLLQQDLDNMLPPILDPQPEPGIPDDDRIIQKPYLYLCSSIVDFDDTVEPEFVKKIDKEHDQDDFLSVLHTEGLVLEDRPKPDETSFTRLHLQDETQTWLSLALRWPKDAPDPLLASVKVDMGTGGITDFLVTFPYAFHSKEAPKAILNFSSAATRDVLGAPPDHGSWGLGAGGILRPMSLLILGLDKASVPSEVTLQDIFAAVQARSGSENDVVLDVLSKMYGETAKFNLDASTGSRSCLWFDPASAYHTILRLQYSIKPDSLSGLNYWIDKTLGLKEFEVANARLITKAESTWTVTSQEMGATNAWSIVMTATCKLGKEDPLLPKAIFEVQVSKITITLQLDKQTSELDGSDQSQSVLDKLISWVTGQWNCEVNFQDFLTGIGMQNFNLPVFRRLILVIGLDPKTGTPTGTVDVNVGIELGLKFGVQDPGGGGKRDQVVFFFTFRWSKGLESQHEASFRGLLWGPPCPETLFDSRLLPSYEPHLVMEPITMDKDSKWTSTLDLENLMPTTMSNVNGQLVETREKVSRIPKGVPKLVTKAMLEISNKSITCEGALGCEEPDPENIPSLILSRIDLRAQYIWAPSRDFHLEFGFGATMFPAETTMLPIELRGSLKYDTAGWSVSAGLETTGAKGAHFLDFFDVKPKSTLSKASSPTQMASSAAALVQHIQLNYLELEYLYNNPRDHSQKNAAKEFHFKGSVSIGNLELNLQFDYMGKKLWTFKTTALASGSKPCTIKEMIDSITADGSIQLPGVHQRYRN